MEEFKIIGFNRILRNMKKSFLALFIILVMGCAQISEDRPAAREGNLIYSVNSGQWSSAKTWNLERIPKTNDSVVISNDTEVEYDVKSSEKVANVTVYGKLSFSQNNDTLLRVGNVLVFGRLEVGTRTTPIGKKAEIRFIVKNETEFKGGFGYEPSDVGLWVIDGSLEINGKKLNDTWARLAKDAAEGDSRIVLDREVDWRPEDHVFITTTSFDMNETEDNYIQNVNGDEIELKYPLRNSHYGSYPLAAEVGLLSRNVLITSDDQKQRAHMIVLGSGSANVSYAEFSHLGPKNKLSRYPIHFHILGNKEGSHIEGNSIWSSGNRCISIHETDNVVVKDNVAFNASGHCFFLETGMEEGNEFINNLGALVFESQTILSDARASVFWITNPRNAFINNSAAASDGPNYWFDLNETFNTSKIRLLAFDNNTGHSSLESALFIEGFGTDTGLDSEEKSVFNDFVAWKSNEQGVWARGTNLVFRNALVFDNPIGFTFANSENILEDSTIIGDYEQNGSYAGGSGDVVYLHGFDIYDGPSVVRNVTFINFTTLPKRIAGAVSYNYPNEFAVSPDNELIDVRFVNSNEFYFKEPNEAAENNTIVTVINDNESFCVMPNTKLGVEKECAFVESWNAWVCKQCRRIEFSGRLVNKANEPVLVDIIAHRLDNNESQVIAYGKGDNLDGYYRAYLAPASYDFKYMFIENHNVSITIRNVSISDETKDLIEQTTFGNIVIEFVLNQRVKNNSVEIDSKNKSYVIK